MTTDKTIENFKKKIYEKYGDTLDLSEMQYVNNQTLIKVICKKHNVSVMVKPTFLLDKKYHWLCPECRKEKAMNEFIEKSKAVHGENTYDYSELNFIDMVHNVRLKCKKHNV